MILVPGSLPFASMKTSTRLSLISKTFARKAFPRLRADDDQLKAPEALARLKGLKKDATQVSKNLLPRLEAALRTTRRWSLADFHSLFVNHPFTRLVTQRLIWGGLSGK